MIKKTLPILLVVLNFTLAIILGPRLPTQMATHWGISGQVDGYSDKNFGLFFMPLLSLVLLVLFSFLPKLEPYRKNFNQFKSYFDNFMIIIFSFFSYIFGLTLVWNLGFNFNMVQFMSPALSALFIYTSVLLKNTKMNWFVGIRTPWTMSSEVVWQQTHDLGSHLFTVVGVFAFFGVIFPKVAFYLFFFPLIFSITLIYFYSYFVFANQKTLKKGKK